VPGGPFEHVLLATVVRDERDAKALTHQPHRLTPSSAVQ
jgi:hypothetical protein